MLLLICCMYRIAFAPSLATSVMNEWVSTGPMGGRLLLTSICVFTKGLGHNDDSQEIETVAPIRTWVCSTHLMI